MKRFNYLLFLPILTGFLFPNPLHAVRPRVAYAAISAAALLSSANIGLSAKKRTAAIRNASTLYGQNPSPYALENLERERLLYTGGAALLGAGLIAAVAIPSIRGLPAARMLRAKNVLREMQHHPLMLSQHPSHGSSTSLVAAVHEYGRWEYDPKQYAFDALKRNRLLLLDVRGQVKLAELDFQAEESEEVKDAQELQGNLTSLIATTQEYMDRIKPKPVDEGAENQPAPAIHLSLEQHLERLAQARNSLIQVKKHEILNYHVGSCVQDKSDFLFHVKQKYGLYALPKAFKILKQQRDLLQEAEQGIRDTRAYLLAYHTEQREKQNNKYLEKRDLDYFCSITNELGHTISNTRCTIESRMEELDEEWRKTIDSAVNQH